MTTATSRVVPPNAASPANAPALSARFGIAVGYVLRGVAVYAVVLLALYLASLVSGALGAAAAREFAVGATLLVAALFPVVAVALAVTAARRVRAACAYGVADEALAAARDATAAADVSDGGVQAPAAPASRRDLRAAALDVTAAVAATDGIS